MIKVLVVEDSYYLGFKLRAILNSDPDTKVVARADSAEETFKKIKFFNPDVIVLDVGIPGIGALDILDNIMKHSPTPTIILGTKSKLDKEEIINAFSYGALDFVLRPDKAEDIDQIKEELVALVKVASSAEIRKLIVKPKKPLRAPKTSGKVVLIGASSGGPPAVESILRALPRNFPASIVVIQHMPPSFTNTFAKRLNNICKIKVEEAKNGSKLKPGKALIAPGGYNLEIRDKDKYLTVKLNKKHTNIRPNINMAFKSAAELCGERVIGVILTGMGHDGAEGMKLIKAMGGGTIVQDKETCLIFGMPESCIEFNSVDMISPLDKIPKNIIDML